jgi:hypothetical protein
MTDGGYVRSPGYASVRARMNLSNPCFVLSPQASLSGTSMATPQVRTHEISIVFVYIHGLI